MTPYLKTERLRLYSPHHRAFDLEQHISWLNDKDTMKYSDIRHCSHTIESQHAYVRGFENSPHHYWEISHSDGCYDFPVGTITAYRRLHDQTANMGLLIGKNFWGHGYGYEAWQAVMDWLFNVERLRKIEAGAYSPNKAMLAIFRKAGMKIEGRRKGSIVLDDGPCDIIEVGRFRHETQKNRNRIRSRSEDQDHNQRGNCTVSFHAE